MNVMKRRILIMARMFFCKNGVTRAKYLASIKIFKKFGNKCAWYSKTIPSEPELMEIHNNVHISSNVRFITHDIVSDMFNNVNEFIDYLPEGRKTYKWYTDGIVVNDNVMIGANSTILYGVNIGRNSIIAAGSIVVKDIEPNTIVGGNPAKEIGKTSDLAKKRALIS